MLGSKLKKNYVKNLIAPDLKYSLLRDQLINWKSSEHLMADG